MLEGKRERIKARIKQAESTEINWPSTRARVVIWQLENELEHVENVLYGMSKLRKLSCA